MERRHPQQVEKPVEVPTPPKPAPQPTRKLTITKTPMDYSETKGTARIKAEVSVLLRLWELTDDTTKRALKPSIVHMTYRIRAIALEAGGYGKSGGNSFAVLRAKTLFCTGKEYDPASHCESITKAGTPCKNKPLIGEVHCHVPTHASRQERDRSYKITRGWQTHFSDLMEQAGLSNEFEALYKISSDREI